MVIAFLIALLVAELLVTIGLVVASRANDESAPLVFGWFLGAFMAATSYVLFYQIFPHVCP